MKNISDEQIRAYFLGKLPETEAENLELECALSATLTALAQTIERELADDYLLKNLSVTDARLFETNYLITAARREKLHAAQGLWRIANEPLSSISPTTEASKISIWEAIRAYRKLFQIAGGAFVLLLVFGAIVFYLANRSVDKNEIAEVKDVVLTPKIEPPAEESSDNSKIQNNEAEKPDPPIVSPRTAVRNARDKETEKDLNAPLKNQPEIKFVSTPKIVKSKPTGFATFVLLAGNLRDEGEQFIKLTPNVKTVNLLLNPAGAKSYKTYRAVLKTADGGTVFSASNLKALSFRTSAEKLESRTYIIFLEGKNANGEFESIDEYTFRVRR